MLRIYPVMLEWLELLAPLIARIARFDADLAKQIRRSSSSVILNTGEGMYSRGGHRTNAYGVALREMGETYAALQGARRRSTDTPSARAYIRGEMPVDSRNAAPSDPAKF